MKCFVAMRFGADDTDGVFEVIKSTLKELDIKVVRVDRIEHNDDIDDRIIREIESADFVIADLTYARPSVYFEAGYAQRVVPVIYTSRRDHFRQREDDPLGNLTVHFDLKMRNIIDWSASNDQEFPKHLRRRVKQVIAPLVEQRTAERRIIDDRIKFKALSIKSRLQRVQTEISKALRAHKYRELAGNSINSSYFVRGAHADGGSVAGFAKWDGSRASHVTSFVLPSLNRNSLEHLARRVEIPSLNLNTNSGTRPTFMNEIYLICVLNRVSMSSAEGVFRAHDVLSAPPGFALSFDMLVPPIAVFGKRTQIMSELTSLGFFIRKGKPSIRENLRIGGNRMYYEESTRPLGVVSRIQRTIRIAFFAPITTPTTLASEIGDLLSEFR